MTACKQENNDGNDIYIINKNNSVKSSLSLLFSICQMPSINNTSLPARNRRYAIIYMTQCPIHISYRMNLFDIRVVVITYGIRYALTKY